MHENDKLLLSVLEDVLPDQLTSLMAIAETKGRPIGELVVEAMRLFLARMPQEERAEAIEILKDGGIDWSKVE